MTDSIENDTVVGSNILFLAQVLDMALTIETGGSTKPAASLWPFYEAKEVIKTIIMVTDEEENGSAHGMRYGITGQKKRP
jgi:hypothetical protein